MSQQPLLPLLFAAVGCGVSLLGVARGQTADAPAAASASASTSAPAASASGPAPSASAPAPSASAPPPAAPAPAPAIASTPDYPSTALTGKTDKSYGESPARMIAGLFLAGLPLSNRNIAGVFGYGTHNAKTGVLDGFGGHTGDVESSAFKTLGFHFAGAGRWTTGAIALDLDFAGPTKALDGVNGVEAQRKLAGSFFYASGVNLLGPFIGGRWAGLGVGPALDLVFGGQTNLKQGDKQATFGPAFRIYPGIDGHLHVYVGPVLLGGHFLYVPKTIAGKSNKADDGFQGVDAAAWKTKLDDGAKPGAAQVMRFYAAVGFPVKDHPREKTMFGLGIEGTIRKTDFETYKENEFRILFGIGLSVAMPSAQAARGAE